MRRSLLTIAAVSLLAAVSLAGDGKKGETELEKTVKPLVAQLGDASFAVREAAMRTLMELGPKAAPILERYRNDPESEVRNRIRRILFHDKEVERLAALGDASTGDWPMLKRGPGRNASDGLGGIRHAPEIDWGRELPFEIGMPYFDSPMLAVGDRLVVVSRSGKILAVDRKTGRTIWSSETGEPAYASPIMAGGMIFVPGKNLTAVDARNGHVLWRWATEYGCSASPLVFGGQVFAVEKGEKIVALDPADGTVQWHERILATNSAPVAVGDLIVVGTEEGLVAFRSSDGKRRWRFKTDSPVTTSPAVLPDRIVVGTRSRFIYAVSADRGREIWHRAIPEGQIRETPAVYGDAIVFATSGSTFRAIRAADGMDLWMRNVGALVVSSPCVTGGVAYFVSDHFFHAFDCTNGDDVWRKRMPGFWTSPILVEGRLLTVSWDGVLLSFK